METSIRFKRWSYTTKEAERKIMHRLCVILNQNLGTRLHVILEITNTFFIRRTIRSARFIVGDTFLSPQWITNAVIKAPVVHRVNRDLYKTPTNNFFTAKPLVPNIYIEFVYILTINNMLLRHVGLFTSVKISLSNIFVKVKWRSRTSVHSYVH